MSPDVKSSELQESSSPEVAYAPSPVKYTLSSPPYSPSPMTATTATAVASEYQQSSYPEVVPENNNYPEVVPGQGQYATAANTKYLPVGQDGYSSPAYSSTSPATTKHSPLPLIPGNVQPSGIDDKEVVGGGNDRRAAICGLPRRKFWIFLGIGLFVLIAAIVGGTVGGVLAGQKSRSGTGSENPESAESGTPEVTSSQTTPSSTTTSSAPTPTASTVETKNGPIQVDCPQSDGVNYTVNGKVFHRECGKNYAFGDLRLVDKIVRSATECIDLCAAADRCVGMVWNKVPQCYLKSGLQQKSDVPGTAVAVLYQ